MPDPCNISSTLCASCLNTSVHLCHCTFRPLRLYAPASAAPRLSSAVAALRRRSTPAAAD